MSILNLYIIYLARKFCETINYSFQNITLEDYFKRGIKHIIRKEQGEFLNRILFHCDNSSSIVNAINLLFKDLLVVILLFSILIYISWYYTLLISLLFIVIFIFNHLFGKNFITPRAELQAKQMSNLYSTFDNIVNGFKLIKIFSIENLFQNKINVITKDIKTNNTILTSANSFPSIIIRLVTFTLFIIVFYIIGEKYNNNNNLNLSYIVVYLFIIYRINQHVASISDYIVQLFSYFPSLKIVYKEITRVLKNQDDYKKIKEISIQKRLIIKKLIFSHNENLLINIKNLIIKKNHFYVLFGNSGSGKSTFADLISGFMEAKSSSYKIDNKTYNYNTIRIKNLGYCNQDGFVFSGSFKENITLFEKKINKKFYNQALKIVELNKKVHENLTKKKFKSFGKSISGGQKQRLNIARMIYKNPDFVILDEATNSIDAKSEINIIKNIKKWAYKNKKTVILITHNPNLKTISKNVFQLINGNILKG